MDIRALQLVERLPPGMRLLAAQFLRFGAVGIIGLGVDIATVYTFRGLFGLYGAGLCGYLIASSVTWALNRIWTFRGSNKAHAHRQWMLFLLANSLGFVLNRGTFFLLVTISALCAREPVLAVAAGSLAGLGSNFTLSRRVVFR